MEKIMNISTQTNSNIENFKKNYCWYKRPTEKSKWNLKQLWTTANIDLQLAVENQQKLVSIEENNENLKNDINNEILDEVKDSISRDFKEQTEEMRKHMHKLKDKNENLRNRSMLSTLIFRGVPEN